MSEYDKLLLELVKIVSEIDLFQLCKLGCDDATALFHLFEPLLEMTTWPIMSEYDKLLLELVKIVSEIDATKNLGPLTLTVEEMYALLVRITAHVIERRK